MRIQNKTLTTSRTKKVPLLTILATQLLLLNEALAKDSPFYPLPVYLTANSSNVKPNVMLNMDSSSSMHGNRLKGAKKAFTDIIDHNPDAVRWGFSTFNYHDFIAVDNKDGHTTKIKTKIQRVQAGGMTPTSITYYQLLRYFQGLQFNSDAWKSKITTTSPMQLRCQKNFIILMSDGDANGRRIPHTYFQNDPVFEDLYLQPSKNVNFQLSRTSLPLYAGKAFKEDFQTSGNDKEGISWNDSAYPLQNIITYTIGFGNGMSDQGKKNLKDAAAAGGGEYFTAENANDLTASLSSILDSIKSIVSTAMPPAYNSDEKGKKTAAIAISFASKNWSSTFYSYAMTATGKIDTTKKVAATYPEPEKRNLWYRSASTGQVKKLSLANKSDIATTFSKDALFTNQALIPYLQGNATANDTHATRAATSLGDVLNSDISIVNRGEMVVVGANDGMVHVFKQNKGGTGYAETFAYIPSLAKRAGGSTLAQAIPNLTKKDYGLPKNPHKYLVDGGSFYRGDASSKQHTVVGSTGRGGAGVYALDMEKIKSGSKQAEAIIFDLTNGSRPANGPERYKSLGYTVGTPVIAKLKDAASAKTVALVANGYYSSKINTSGNHGRPALYAINLQPPYQGVLYQELLPYQAGAYTNNGLSSPLVVDVDADGYADYAYAGDLHGNLYRFDLRSGKTHSEYVVKVFAGSPSKPISAAPTLLKQGNKLTIIFGTGKFLDEKDNQNKATQSVYGIIDDLSVTGNLTAKTEKPITEADLLKQTITNSGTAATRIATAHELTAKNQGWMFDLSTGTGERVIYQPVVFGNTLFLTSQIVQANTLSTCNVAANSGYLLVVDAQTGGVPKQSNAQMDSLALAAKVVGKRMVGMPSQVGGLHPITLNRAGTNAEGQILPGLIPDVNPKDPTYIGGSYHNNQQEGYLSISIENGTFYQGKVTKPNPDKPNPDNKYKSVIRRISWRQLF